jgi:para-nitrobenzyl esterase
MVQAVGRAPRPPTIEGDAVGGPIAETTHGRVQGATQDGVHVFLGIPYGGDTGGTNRFRPPPPPVPWVGTREATSFGPSSWQPSAPGASETLKIFGGFAEPSMGEDCLVLNVWTPGTTSSDRPVLVYFHGGGHTSGSGSWPAYDGAALARRYDAVVVTVNHRLGLLGYLDLGELGGGEYPTSGANGVLDLVASLEWVRDNIAHFGGDPSRVLAYGESGGGWKTSTLLAMPSARDLFQRACLMSGAGIRCQTTDEATAIAERTLGFLGLDRSQLSSLADIPAARLLEAQNAAGVPGFQPVLDGTHIVGHPLDLLRAGTTPDVPLLIGTTRDEFRTFAMAMPQPADGADDAWLADQLRHTVGAAATALVAGYRTSRPGASVFDLQVAINTDHHMRIPSIRMAEAASGPGRAPVFMYRFDWETPALGGMLKAGHGVDYPFFFDNLESATVTSEGPGREALASQMSGAVTAFAATGDPGHDLLPAWPPYDGNRRATMRFGLDSLVVDDPDGDERGLWDGII